MTAFRFRAARPDGELVNGTLEAPSATAALHLVGTRGLLPVELSETGSEQPVPAAPASAELAEALEGLGALLNAGLPADRALAAASATAAPRVGAALEGACERVREGASLSAALEASGAMPPLVTGLLRAGERTGRLAATVIRAAAEVEREVETRARLRAALTYPAFVAATGFVSIIVIAGFIVPRFAELIGGQGRQLPAATRALLSLSGVIRQWGPPLAVLAAVAVVALVRMGRTPAGTLALHRWLLRLPVVGSLRLRFATARVCAALGALLEAGIPVLPALRHASAAAGDRAIEALFDRVRSDVERGERLAAALRRHGALAPSAVRLVAFGESAGSLPAFLDHAANLEARSAQRAVMRGIGLVEPVLVLVFGAIVALVAAALFQAIYSARPGAM